MPVEINHIRSLDNLLECVFLREQLKVTLLRGNFLLCSEGQDHGLSSPREVDGRGLRSGILCHKLKEEGKSYMNNARI